MNKIITIDGPSAGGKSSLAKALAKHYHFLHLSGGTLYRAVALKALEKKIPATDKETPTKIAQELSNKDILELIPDQRLYTSQISQKIPDIINIQGVRITLNKLKQTFIHAMVKETSVIIDGRDEGKIVFPEAQIKFFITATMEERAHRRHKERVERGENITYEDVFAYEQNRDKHDAINTHPAPEAYTIDTTNLTQEEVLRKAIKIIDENKKTL